MNSIERRLATAIVLGSLFVLGIGSLVFYWSARMVLLRDFDTGLKTRALSLAAFTTEEKGEISFEISGHILSEYQFNDRGNYFQLWSKDNQTLARSPSLAAGSLPRKAGTIQLPKYWNLVLPNGDPGRAIGIQFIPDSEDANGVHSMNETGAPVILVLAQSLSNVSHTLIILRSLLITLGLTMLVAMIVMTRIVIRRSLFPLTKVTDQAATIDASSLGQRFSTEVMPTELVPICKRLNDLLARLERSFVRERQFSEDAAHELRTPISELRSWAEVSLRWPGDAEMTILAFQDALQIAYKMETIVTQLLALARCESGGQAVALTDVLVAQVVHEAWRPFADRAASRSLSVAFEVPPELCVQTDRNLLGVILTNLFSNAVEYSSVNGTISIQGELHPGLFKLTVSNTVEHLAADDLPHLFERFWRKDNVRTPSEHTGLGLALSKALSEVLDLALSAELVHSTFVITLQGPTLHRLKVLERDQNGRFARLMTG